jgi:DNA-binding transcriptional regulator YiaG
MITNDRQYRITSARLKKFERDIEDARARGPRARQHPALHAAMIASLQGQAADLRTEIARYDALKRGAIATGEIDELAEFGRAAIEARIAANLTQEQLAERVGVKPQQIQKWESTAYASVNLRSLTRVLKALDAHVKSSIRYATK